MLKDEREVPVPWLALGVTLESQAHSGLTPGRDPVLERDFFLLSKHSVDVVRALCRKASTFEFFEFKGLLSMNHS